MSKQTAEVIQTIKGMITLETLNKDGDVNVYIRESKNGIRTSEGSITISLEAFYDLTQPILQEINEIRYLKLEDK